MKTNHESMAKDYSELSKEELIKTIGKIEFRKKYGLIWDEEKTKEQFERESENALPVLKQNKGKGINASHDKPINILIEGDNYHALSVLNYTHQGKIDLIYIDPPYNTGNKDFRYNDSYVDREDSYKHSKWLSFMNKRLRLAKNLLKESGLFFISIDDNEYAQLKLLCDDIFGEKNFRNSIVMSRVKKNIQERQYAKSLNLGHGFILFYAMPDAEIAIPTKIQKKEERWHAFDAPGIRKTMEYKIFGHKPPKGRHWMFEEKKAQELIDKGLLRPNVKTGKPQYKLEASDSTRLDTNWSDLQEGDAEWQFENGEKNVELIKRVIGMYPTKNCLILDFFAGSGTTGHAVLGQNFEDGGQRQFILCTNDENNICSKVCYPRLKKVIKGYTTKRGKKVDGISSNLMYLSTSFVKKSLSLDELKIRITEKCTEMLCLREGIFRLKKETKNYRIFERNKKVMAIYYALDTDGLDDLRTELNRLSGEKILYCFTLDPFGLDKNNFADWKNIKLEPIPQKIIDIYEAINKF